MNQALKNYIEEYKIKKEANEIILEILKAHEEVVSLSTIQDNYGIKSIEELESVVYSAIQSNIDNKKNYICWKLLVQKHLFNNGNKRTFVVLFSKWNSFHGLPSKDKIIEMVVNKPSYQEFKKSIKYFTFNHNKIENLLKELEME